MLMSLFDDIMSGLEEAIEYEKGIIEANTIVIRTLDLLKWSTMT